MAFPVGLVSKSVAETGSREELRDKIARSLTSTLGLTNASRALLACYFLGSLIA